MTPGALKPAGKFCSRHRSFPVPPKRPGLCLPARLNCLAPRRSPAEPAANELPHCLADCHPPRPPSAGSPVTWHFPILLPAGWGAPDAIFLPPPRELHVHTGRGPLGRGGGQAEAARSVQTPRGQGPGSRLTPPQLLRPRWGSAREWPDSGVMVQNLDGLSLPGAPPAAAGHETRSLCPCLSARSREGSQGCGEQMARAVVETVQPGAQTEPRRRRKAGRCCFFSPR